MINLFRPHGTHNTDVIGYAANLWEKLANLLPRLPKLLKSMLWAETNERPTLELGNLLSLGERLGHRLAVHFGELWLVIESLQMRGPAGLIQEDHALGLWRVMERIHGALGGRGVRSKQPGIEQGIEAQDAEGRNAASEKSAALDAFTVRAVVHICQFLVIVS